MERTPRALAVLLLVGCYTGAEAGLPTDAAGSAGDAGEASGTLTDGDGESETQGDDGSTELPEEPLVPTGWARLSRAAYRNTLADLLVYASDPATGQEVFAALDGVLARVPADAEVDYASHDQSMSQAHVDAFFEVGMQLGQEMTSTDARVEAFVGACATDADPSNDAACIDAFIDRFGGLAHRAPLRDAERAFYCEAVGDVVDRDAIADLIAIITTSPRFLYRIELGTDDFDGGGAMEVSAHELASRISYLLWHSMPDPELLDAAADGTLASAEGLEQQVDRMFRDARTQRAFEAFFRHWLELEDAPNLAGAVTDPAYAALAGAQAPSPELAEDMAREVLDSIAYHVWSADDDIEQWFASPFAFPRTEELAAIYGVSVWDGQSEPPLAPEARAGLLTRPAFLAATSMRSRPILRGALVREELLCDVLPPPPPDAQGSAGVPAPTDGARAWVEQVTSADGCAACHVWVNPLGFALEGFDSLGRERSEERLFDETGALVATLPIDTGATLSIGDVQREVSTPHEVADMMLESGRLQACLAQEYFRYAYGRDVEDDTADVAIVEHLEGRLVEGDTLAGFLQAIALHPTFRARGWEAP